MTILRIASAIADADYSTGTVNIQTNGTYMDTVAVEGFTCNSGGLCDFNLPAHYLDFWVGFYYSNGQGTLATGSGLYFGVFDSSVSSTYELFGFWQNSTGTRVSYFNGTTRAYSPYLGYSLYGTGLKRIDVHFKIAASGGIIELFVDGKSVASFSGVAGDTDYASALGVDMFRATNYAQSSASSAYSGIVMADEDTRRFRVIGLEPTANGTHTDWTGGYGDIDETGYSDTDYLYSDAADEKSTFVFADVPAQFSQHKVAGVCLSGRGIGDVVSPQLIRGIARLSSVDYELDPTNGMPATINGISYLWTTNPATSAAWTISEVNAGEFGFRSAS